MVALLLSYPRFAGADRIWIGIGSRADRSCAACGRLESNIPDRHAIQSTSAHLEPATSRLPRRAWYFHRFYSAAPGTGCACRTALGNISYSALFGLNGVSSASTRALNAYSFDSRPSSVHKRDAVRSDKRRASRHTRVWRKGISRVRVRLVDVLRHRPRRVVTTSGWSGSAAVHIRIATREVYGAVIHDRIIVERALAPGGRRYAATRRSRRIVGGTTMVLQAPIGRCDSRAYVRRIALRRHTRMISLARRRSRTLRCRSAMSSDAVEHRASEAYTAWSSSLPSGITTSGPSHDAFGVRAPSDLRASSARQGEQVRLTGRPARGLLPGRAPAETRGTIWRTLTTCGWGVSLHTTRRARHDPQHLGDATCRPARNSSDSDKFRCIQ